MVQAVLRMFSQDAEQNRTIFVSTDSRFYILGNLYDASIDIDAVRRNRIDISKAPYKGKSGAPVSVVMFTDPGCTSCKEAHRAIDDEKMIESYKGKVKLVFKPFPLKSHPGSFEAAVAASCAGKEDMESFWRYIDAVFARTEPIPAEKIKETLMGIAQDVKLNMKKFEACYDQRETSDPVIASIEEGKNLGIQSTPTFFINGRVYVGFHGVDKLKKVIDELLPK
jgi:protein-disulfide isomerase